MAFSERYPGTSGFNHNSSTDYGNDKEPPKWKSCLFALAVMIAIVLIFWLANCGA